MANVFLQRFRSLFIFGFMFCASLSWGSNDFGAGIFLGDPTAITIKYWRDKQIAFDAGMGFAVANYFIFYGDYLYHFPQAFKHKEPFLAQLTPYVGVGGIMAVTTNDRSQNYAYYGKNSGSFGLGVKVPVGIEWRPREPSLGVFVEIAPGISIIPATTAIFTGGIGVRYYF